MNEQDVCAREPIHVIGHIQPHGLLFALSEPDLIVRQVSANVATMLGIPVDRLLGGSFEAVLGARPFEQFQSAILHDDRVAFSLRLERDGRELRMHCDAHRQEGALIVELELLDDAHSLEPFDLDAHVQIPFEQMEGATDVADLTRRVAGELQRLSGFERVMVYRFDREWSGEVIAEVTGTSPLAYLGSRFPASDIPAQARRLFLLNRLRAIADVDAEPVPIVPEFGPQTGRPLDLTRSHLRSAAPIHLAYLRNMGVRSTMTVSIVVDRQLWGMIAFHDPLPRRVDFSTRSVCEMIGKLFSSQLASRLDTATLQARLKARTLLEDYMATTEAAKVSSDAEHFRSLRIVELFDADGLISRIDGAVFYRGDTVREELLLPVVGTLRDVALRGIASTNMLGALDRDSGSFATAVSGALYIGLAEGSGDYLMLVRRELLETIVWAGNPEKAIGADASGQLRPRASFAAWRETVRGRSRPWTALEIESAGLLREQLLRLREAQRLRKSQERVRYLAHHDTLTGLINRHSIHLRLGQFVKRAASDHSRFVVLFIDLDRFKYFNDTYGHGVGDRILRIVAKRMSNQIRDGDAVGRLGGDEFIIVLHEPGDEADVLQAVSRILHAIEKPLEIATGTTINITASIGLSRYPEDGASSESLVRRSDMAMYRVKRGGGNAFELFRASDDIGSERTAS